jgi:hypothetical protein
MVKRAKRATRSKGPTRTGDLGAIERELNSDEAARNAFLKSPASYLGKKGLRLSRTARSELGRLVTEMKEGPRLARGTAVGTRPDVTISISIRKDF